MLVVGWSTEGFGTEQDISPTIGQTAMKFGLESHDPQRMIPYEFCDLLNFNHPLEMTVLITIKMFCEGCWSYNVCWSFRDPFYSNA